MARTAFDFIAPFLTIWVRPRATIRKIVDSDPTRLVLLIAGTSSVLSCFIVQHWLKILPRTSQMPHEYFVSGLYAQGILALFNPSGTWQSRGTEDASLILAAAFVGALLLYFSGAILKWTGRLFGGTATGVEARAAFAWSQVPLIIALMCRLSSWIDSHGTQGTPSNGLLLTGYVVFFIWWLIALIKCVSEVHHFSAWRGLGAVVLWLYSIPLPPLLGMLIFSLGRSLASRR
ncbi:MAG TPA: YIP1 family protein [Patescibacteria group bacterium]|nr:YIP1 family protein [Patescibacteria group bacterium]